MGAELKCWCPVCGHEFSTSESCKSNDIRANEIAGPLSAPQQHNVTLGDVQSGKTTQRVGVLLVVISLALFITGVGDAASKVVSMSIGIIGLGLFLFGHAKHWFHAKRAQSLQH